MRSNTSFYEFIGKDSLGYIHGQTYLVHVHESRTIERFLRGYKKDWRIIMTLPYFCPYTSWEAFHDNWLPKNMKKRNNLYDKI